MLLISLCFVSSAPGIEEVKARLVVAPPKYVIKVIDKNGIRTVSEV